jgi:mRNA-degrading endonuclease toxin of MazEF toxin-antitoxin module
MVSRPAVVITPEPVGPSGMLIWTVMITNAARDAWPGDVAIPQSESLGLLIPSKVRTAKIAPAEVVAATRVGRLDERTWREVHALVGQHLGFT